MPPARLVTWVGIMCRGTALLTLFAILTTLAAVGAHLIPVLAASGVSGVHAVTVSQAASQAYHQIRGLHAPIRQFIIAENLLETCRAIMAWATSCVLHLPETMESLTTGIFGVLASTYLRMSSQVGNLQAIVLIVLASWPMIFAAWLWFTAISGIGDALARLAGWVVKGSNGDAEPLA